MENKNNDIKILNLLDLFSSLKINYIIKKLKIINKIEYFWH
jgi:hypothetical protein